MRHKHRPNKRIGALIAVIVLLCGTLAEVGVAQSALLSTAAVILYWAIAWVNEH